MRVVIDYPIACSECGCTLKHRIDHETIKIEPCKNCLKKEYLHGFDDGVFDRNNEKKGE